MRRLYTEDYGIELRRQRHLANIDRHDIRRPCKSQIDVIDETKLRMPGCIDRLRTGIEQRQGLNRFRYGFLLP